MKNAARHIVTKTVIFLLIFIIFFPAVFSGCGGEADTITPSAISVSTTGSLTGTVYPQIISVYPDGSTNPQVDTQIVIVFSKPIAIGTVAANISITPSTAYTESLACGGYAVVLQPSSDLLYSQLYNVTILTGIQDSVNGYNLSTGGTYSFTTASSTAAAQQPRVISATRFPSGTGVGKNLQYVEVTFTESVTNVTTSTFTISGGTITALSTAVVPDTDNKTWRLDLDTATIDYGQTYTVTLTNGIQTAGGLTLVIDGSETWTFQIESDPASAPYTFTDIWVESVTATTATIKYTSSKPIVGDYSRAEAGITSGTYTISNVEGGTTGATVHTVTLTGLNAGETYYYRGWLDIDGSGTETAGDVYSVEYSFMTANDATVNSILSNAVNNQDGLVLLQTNYAGSYAFWVDNDADIYGQYFSSADGSIQWGAGGAAVSSHANTQNGIVAITDGFARAVVIYNDSNSLYAKMVYDSSGINFTWPGNGAAANLQGIDLGLAIKAGSSYSACIVHEIPDIISSGVADMPDNGTPTNLLYDADVDFSAFNTWLDVNDLLLTNTGATAWNNYTINNQTASPYDLFPYVLWTSGVTNLGAFTDYYVVDVDVTNAGTSDDGNTTTSLICSTGTNLLSVVSGDIVRIGVLPGEWGIATASGYTAPYFWVSIDRAIAGLVTGASFTIYTNHAGPFTSEAVTNPLWDTAPSTFFNPGVTVLAGDYIVNENNNTAAATGDTVAAIGVEDTDYALRLSAVDIMNNGNIYSIVRLPAGFTYKAVGYSTNIATDFNLTDGFNPFGAVAAGDIVFNIDQNLSSMVTAAAAGSLTLTADIFNGTNQKAIVYTKRGFLVTYVNTSDYIVARAFNIADGLSLGAAFNVCTAGTNSRPLAVSDGAGNAIIFYEKSNLVYVKKVSAKGGFVWTNSATVSDPGIQVTTIAGYKIIQALPDKAVGSTGGAFLLVANTSGNFQLWHVGGNTTGTAASVSGVLTGYDPRMVVDYDSQNYNRVIIVYRAPHVISVNYYHIEVVVYQYGVGVYGPVVVSDNTKAYNCYQPSITLADNTAGRDYFYVSWFDGRYFNPLGYSIYAQEYTSAVTPVAVWTAYGLYVSMPTSMGYDNTLYMRLLYWNDGATPFGVLPIWLDYRGADTDIYYQKLDSAGTFVTP